jgi:SAM-dependent methyltransferase
MSNPEYTSLWTDDFDEAAVQRYDDKFKTRWEKNIKHREQIAFISKYLEDWMFWCDAPIGSGRLMQALKTQKMLGYDLSDGFLEYNRRRGIDCEKGDLFEFGNLYQDEFDLVTSLHTIFAFSDFDLILRGFVKGLKPGGILIVDITNKLHSNATQEIKALIFEDPDRYPDGLTRSEIEMLFESLGCELVEIQPHDFWDNYFVFRWLYFSGNVITKRIRKYFWAVLNFAYFYLPLAGFLSKLEVGRPEYQFTKYLVAARKR